MARFVSPNMRRQINVLGDVVRTSAARITALDEETLHRQLQLAAIPAPTGAEHNRADAVATVLTSLKCDTAHVDAAGNVIASRTESVTAKALAPIVCMAHLDTVFEIDTPLRQMRAGSRIHCPGIGDNSRGLSVMLTLARLFNEQSTGSPHRRPIEFVATVGEEGLGNLRGAKAYFADRAAAGKPDPHAVIVLDGPGDQNIVHHAIGSRRYRVVFQGSGGHSWADFGAPNAVHAASRAAAWLADVPRTLGSKVAITVSRIGGGESMNAIPANAFMEIDVRGTDNLLLMKVDAELRAIIKAAVLAETAGVPSRATNAFGGDALLRYTITLLGERPCGELSREHDLVQLAQVATQQLGVDPVSAIASTDSNVPLSLGIPAITIGGGGTGGAAHTINEWYDNTNGPRGVVRAFAILSALAI